ncbi:MAG TPA: hypothetical protein VGO34_07725 [Alphaproteobacteria bacterium]|jgi:hypothetical protein
MNNVILKAMSVLAFTATLAGSAYAADSQDSRARGSLVMQGDQGVAVAHSDQYAANPSEANPNEPVARATAVLPAGNVFYQVADEHEGPVDGD